VRKYIQEGGNVNIEMHAGETPMMLAVKTGHTQICEALINAGAKANLNDALAIAVQKGHEYLCEILISAGADAETALSHNLIGNKSLCKFLLDHNANPNVLNSHKSGPLGDAIVNNHEEMALMLLNAGATVSTKVTDRTALTLGAKYSKESICKLLITNSHFTPYYTKKQIQEAQDRTFTRLCIMNKVCPSLPRDLKGVILSRNIAIWQDALCTPLLIHTKRYDRVMNMPRQVLGTLIKHNALDLEQTVSTLKGHKINQLIPLMMEAVQTTRNENVRTILDADLLEQNYGKEIEKVIELDLLKKA
jgi:hypothetical protein